MKKLLVYLVLPVLVLIAAVYILIPNNIIVTNIIYTGVKSTSILRGLHADTKWQEWFPGKTESKNFTYNDQQYIPGEKEYAAQTIAIEAGNMTYTSRINVIEVNFDSSILQWNLNFKASNNPFKRISQYQTAKKIKNNMHVILNNFIAFVQQTKNIYGFDIQRSTLTDTTLVSIRTLTHQYPSTQLIYSLVNKLKQYILQQHASEHNYPMLNVTRLQDSSYEVMVGIPTNIPLNGNSIIKPKRMVMLKNKTIVTKITGDNNTIQEGFNATNTYMNDHQLSSPVIPFLQLVTDRSKEKDSTKWITNIFTPVS